MACSVGLCPLLWVTPTGTTAPAFGGLFILNVSKRFNKPLFYGGNLHDGSYCGLFYWYLSGGVGDSYWNDGARKAGAEPLRCYLYFSIIKIIKFDGTAVIFNQFV